MPEAKLNYVAIIEGRAAEMIIDKVADYRKSKNITIGKSRATQLLLCELYALKYSSIKDNKPCD